MSQTKGNLVPKGGSLDKLAPSGTEDNTDQGPNIVCQLAGRGIDRKTLKHKIPKKKFITQMTCMALMQVAKENGEMEWEQRYRNSYYCLDNIKTHGGKAHGLFCKNRFCLVCASNRKATYINRLLPELVTWDDPYFVTLTCKAQTRINLNKWMCGMVRSFDLINRRLRKRYERGKGPKPIGIRALECNFNPQKKTYNPHLHLIVASKQIAMEFILEWQNTWTDKYTHPDAQDMRPIKKTLEDLIETIKYGAKIFTDPDMIKDKRRRSKSPKIYAAALHEIYKAMKGRNLLSTFGFKQSNTGGDIVPKTISEGDIIDWHYQISTKDWLDPLTGQLMTKYIPDSRLENLLESNLNMSAR